MDVVGGKSRRFTIGVVNARTEIDISKRCFDAGIQPWYKVQHYKVGIKNFNPNFIQVMPIVNQYETKEQRLISGYLNVRPLQCICLQSDYGIDIDVAVFMGLNQKFHSAFGLEVNGEIPASVEFKGCSGIPMVSVLNLKRLASNNLTTEEEYRILNSIFMKQTRHIVCNEPDITEADVMEFKHAIGICNFEDLESEFESQNLIDDTIQPKDSSSSETEKKESSDIAKTEPPITVKDHLHITEYETIELQPVAKRPQYRAAIMQVVDPDLIDFCVLDYPVEYPASIRLHHLIEMQHFQDEIFSKGSAWKNYQKIIEKYVMKEMSVEKAFNEKFEQPIRPSSFKIQPLPYYSSSYLLNFGKISLDTEINWEIELFYHGPGKANFSVRSLIVVPGMKIMFLKPDFSCDGLTGSFKFTINNYILESNDNSKYRNMQDRSSEDIRSIHRDGGECHGKILCHSHSYDFDSNLIHTREVTPEYRLAINEFYSSWNRPNKEQKDPLTHCEIFQERLADTQNKVFKFCIKFKPTEEYYDDPTIFEDFIYIDIHLGPTIPILIQGEISTFDSQREKEIMKG